MVHALDLLALLDLTARGQAADGLVRHPTPRASLVKREEVERHRNLSCTEYDACLDVAYRRDWPSWSCRRCHRFHLRVEARRAELAHGGAARPFA